MKSPARRTRTVDWMAGLIVFLAVFSPVAAQNLLLFSNAGPGFSVPVRDTYGCVLEPDWNAGLLLGAVPDVNQMALITQAPFGEKGGCGNGVFRLGPVQNLWNGTVYASVAIWRGPGSPDAMASRSSPVAFTVSAGGGLPEPPVNLYITNIGLQGPITTWVMFVAVAGHAGGGFGQPIIAVRGDEVSVTMATPPPSPYVYRSPTGFRWERRTAGSDWIVVNTGLNTLTFPAVQPSEAGEYRVAFNFGCNCDEQVVPFSFTVLEMERTDGLALSGPVGSKYRIDYAESLNGTSWTFLTDVVLSTGRAAHLDPGFPSAGSRFYRVANTW